MTTQARALIDLAGRLQPVAASGGAALMEKPLGAQRRLLDEDQRAAP